MSSGKEIKDWGARECLPPDTIKVLLDQGFTSLDDLRDLAPEDVIECFQKTGLLPLANCVKLKKALARLSDGSTAPPAYSPPHSAPGFASSAQERLQTQKTGHTPAARSRPPTQPGVSGISAGVGAVSISGEHTGGDHFRFILVGKTGSGKSTTGNTILGNKRFQTSLSFESVTRKCDLNRGNRDGALIEILDSPGLYDTSKTQEEIGIAITKAVACMHPGPDAVLLVIRLGRFTGEELGSYKRLKAMFDSNITKYIIIIFTGGDDLMESGETFDSIMKYAPKEIPQILMECGNRRVIFNNRASKPAPQVDELLTLARGLKRQNGGPYLCPKYETIGKTLQEEVKRRLDLVEREELKGKKHVQELEQKSQQLQKKVDMECKEKKERQQEVNRLQEELEAQERRQIRYREEMDRLKDSIARDEEPGLFGKIVGFVKDAWDFTKSLVKGEL